MNASNKMLVIVQNAKFTGLFLSYLEKQNKGGGGGGGKNTTPDPD